jgi:hypothetical protein
LIAADACDARNSDTPYRPVNALPMRLSPATMMLATPMAVMTPG